MFLIHCSKEPLLILMKNFLLSNKQLLDEDIKQEGENSSLVVTEKMKVNTHVES